MWGVQGCMCGGSKDVCGGPRICMGGSTGVSGVSKDMYVWGSKDFVLGGGREGSITKLTELRFCGDINILMASVMMSIISCQ